MKHTLALVLMVFGIVGCALDTQLDVYSQHNAKPVGCSLDIYRHTDFIKKPSEVIAFLSFEDGGLAVGCSREMVMDMMRSNACEVGADAVLISNEISPNISSTCYRADASMLVYKKEEVR